MADRKVSDLQAAEAINDTDLLLMDQDGVAKNIPGSLLKSFAKEQAGEAFGELPGYSSISFTKSGSTVTMAYEMSDGETGTGTITLDENGYPSKINLGGTNIPVSWEGFEDE